MNAVVILDWRPVTRGNLVGFAKVEMPSGLILNDCTIMNGDRGPWASPPGRPMFTRDGVVMRDDAGKVKYTPIIEFRTAEIRNVWSAAVIAALRTLQPPVFEG